MGTVLQFPDRDPERAFLDMAKARRLEAVLCQLDGDTDGYVSRIRDARALDEQASLARVDAQQRRERLERQFQQRVREDRAAAGLIALVRQDVFDAG